MPHAALAPNSIADQIQSSFMALKRPTVYLSPATVHDARVITSVYLRAFADSPHFPIFSPECVNFSDEELLHIGVPLEMDDFRRRLLGTNISIKASISTTNERGETVETVVGYANWTSPDGPRKRTLWEWFLSTIIYPIYWRFFKPIHTPESILSLLELMAEQREKVFGEGQRWEGRKYWYLHILCVDPQWQGCGVGSALLQWGFERARQSGSLVYLESSPVALPIYAAKGFRVVANTPRKICDIYIEVPGMIWEPRLNRK